MRYPAHPVPQPERWNTLPEQLAITTSAVYSVLVVGRHFRIRRTDRASGEITYRHGAARAADVALVHEQARATVRACWPSEFHAPLAAE
jgi:hypothetical protein